MSEVNNTTPEEVKEELELVIDQDQKMKFPTLASSKLTSTDELCGWVNRLFGEVFADYDGSVVKFNQSTGRLYISLFFNQIDAVAEGDIRAFEPAGGTDKSDTNSGLRRIQALERTVINGNKYVITDAAKSMLAKCVAKDNRGEVNWNALNLITQNFEPVSYGYGKGKTQNVINLIDPRAVLRELFGTKVNTYVGNDENGAPVFEEHDADYEIIVLRALGYPNQFMMNPQVTPEEGPFEIDIRQIDQKQLIESQKRLGITATIGKRIIRERV